MATGTAAMRVPLSKRGARVNSSLGAEAHDVIALGSGHGFPGVFPDLTEMARVALNEYRHETLQYGPTLGLPEMREWIAGYLNENGVNASLELSNDLEYT